MTLSVLLAAETGLQIGCSTSSKFAKKWAGYIDKGLSEKINPEASLRKLSELIDENKFEEALELYKESLNPEQLDFERAAKLAALGFADYIFVLNDSDQWYCFFVPTGCILSTRMGIYNYLQYLINKCQQKKTCNRNNYNLNLLLEHLSSIKETVYEHGVPYTAWTKLKATAGDAWNAVKHTFDSNEGAQILPPDYYEEYMIYKLLE